MMWWHYVVGALLGGALVFGALFVVSRQPRRVSELLRRKPQEPERDLPPWPDYTPRHHRPSPPWAPSRRGMYAGERTPSEMDPPPTSITRPKEE